MRCYCINYRPAFLHIQLWNSRMSLKLALAFLIALSSFVYLSEGSDLVAPNALANGEFLQEGDWVFLNQNCSLTLTNNGNLFLQTFPSAEGTSSNCTLTMRMDGDLVLTRDDDGAEEFNTYTSAVAGVQAATFLLHLQGTGELSIQGSDYSTVIALYSPIR